jgi:hypothetical protein
MGVTLVDYEWPDDINEWDAWPEPTGVDWIDGLVAHLDGFTFESFREALIEEALSSDDAVIIAECAAERCPDLVGKIRWLQEPLYNTNLWPEYWGDGYHDDYLGLMWKVTELIGAHLQDQESASAALDELMQDDDIWHFAVGPAAILAQCPVKSDSVNAILRTFITYWPQYADGMPREVGRYIDCDHAAIISAAPFLAIACLNPAADVALAKQVAEICSRSPDDSERLANEFWEYVTGCLVEDRKGYNQDFSGVWWCPVVTWRDGFFQNGLPKGLALPVGPEQLRALVSLFLEGFTSWKLVNVHGDEQLPETATAAFAARPELTNDQLAVLAVQPWGSTRKAVIANPSARDETKALAAIGD